MCSRRSDVRDGAVVGTFGRPGRERRPISLGPCRQIRLARQSLYRRSRHRKTPAKMGAGGIIGPLCGGRPRAHARPSRSEKREANMFGRLRTFALARRALGLANLTALLIVMPLIADAAGAPKVETTDGPIEGFYRDGVAEFLGIPYAAPPISDLRWRPPQPPAQMERLPLDVNFGNSLRAEPIRKIRPPEHHRGLSLPERLHAAGLSPKKPSSDRSWCGSTVAAWSLAKPMTTTAASSRAKAIRSS